MEQLYRRNLTIASITAEAEGEPVYRHHTLFSRLLARQLERELPGEIVELHRRAARAQTTPGRAIAHYLTAGLWEEAAELMVQSGADLLARGMSETIRSRYHALPAQARATHPRLSVLMGRCEIHRGDYAAAGPLLSQARVAFVAAGDLAGEAGALTSLITLAYQNDDRAGAAGLVDRALGLPLGPMGRVAAMLARAWLRLSGGDWAACRGDLGEALGVLRATGDRPAALMAITYMSAAPMAAVPGCLELTESCCAVTGDLALPDTALRLGADELSLWPLVLRGRTDAALAVAGEVEALRQRVGGYPVLGNDSAVLLAVLQTARGDLAAAGRAVDALVQRLDRAPRSKRMLHLHAAGRTMALLGRRTEAEEMHRRLAALNDDLPLTAFLRDHLAGLLALLADRPDQAEDILIRATEWEARPPIARVGGSARLLLARLLLDQGQTEAALAAVTTVLGAWDEADTPGCALFDGPAGLPALRLAAEHGHGGAARLLPLFSSPTGARRPWPAAPGVSGPAGDQVALSEPLTQREGEVLRLIVAGRTNRQIAQELFIATETVKSHVVHIFRKLDVTSRTQAAIRGRELGF